MSMLWSGRMSPERATQEAAVMQRLSTLDRYLPLWIALAMAAGLALGALIPGFDDALDALRIGTVSLPIAIGLLLMMYPVLAKVRYEEIGKLSGERGLMGASLFLNWIFGPLLMFALAWIFLADQPEYRTGLIIVGLARCIAMVLIWSDLARADNDATALLVAINSLFQIVAYSLLGWLYLTGLPSLLGLDTQGFEVSLWEVARTVLIFLGIPLVAGYLTRRIGIRRRGERWYQEQFLPRIGPVALYGLLFTIVMLFALQGDAITSQPLDVVRIAIPLLVYFFVMFFASFALGKAIGLSYPRTGTLAFTAASNNFELAIAVAVGVFGATSGQALAGVVGPLIEVPVLVGLVYVSLWLGRRWFGEREVAGHPLKAVHAAEDAGSA
jgi:ACR3 family arsenite transporter